MDSLPKAINLYLFIIFNNHGENMGRINGKNRNLGKEEEHRGEKSVLWVILLYLYIPFS